MSATPTSPGRWRLPAWATSREQARGGDPASFVVRSIETALAILIGLVLAAAVVTDVVRQTHINTRTTADKHTWLSYALAHRTPYAQSLYKRLGVDLPQHGTIDYVCQPTALTTSIAVHQRRLCLEISGPIHSQRRAVVGGFFVLPNRGDRYAARYGCFGVPAQRRVCGLRRIPPTLR